MSRVRSAPKVWWGEWSLHMGEAGRWEIGPLSLWIARLPFEWRIVYREVREHLDEALLVNLPIPASEVPIASRPTELNVTRFGLSENSGHIALEAALADRPVVIRPETPLYVPARQSIDLFVSTSVWAVIKVGYDARTLYEVPTFRPPDTWFGPSTIEGELCYASRTAARLSIDEVPQRLHRAVTPVQVRNRGDDPLLIERIQLPVQYLSLFSGNKGYLWTEPVIFERFGGEAASVKIGHGAPRWSVGARLISSPRLTPGGNLITRTFSAFHAIF